MDSTTMFFLFSLLVAFFGLKEQITYLKKKRSLPGPILIIPFIGNLLSLVKNPTKFWDSQALAAKSSTLLGVSSNYIIGRFMVFIRSPELCHKIFSNVHQDAFSLIAHPFGKKLFGEHNFIYMTGEEHKDLRRQLAPNFTPKALSTYMVSQQNILLQHINIWRELSSQNPSVPLELGILCRTLNLETSQTAFLGPYLRSPEARQDFSKDYHLFSAGLMAIPIDLPGLAFRDARLAVERLIKSITVCVKESRSMMSSGQRKPSCFIDFWMQEILNDQTRQQQQSSDVEIGRYLFDFLYGAHDTTTSSLIWAVTLLEQHPHVVSKIRQEVARVWSRECNTLITADQLQDMKYTHAVAREVLRYRPPAALVPHIAAQDFPLTETYTIPKGALVFPSILESSFQGFTDPDLFDPDRFSDKRQEDRIYKRNLLVFGAGAHRCIGQRYAVNYLVLFIAIFTSLLDFKRHRSQSCDEIIYVPTTCPKDNCLGYLSTRCIP